MRKEPADQTPWWVMLALVLSGGFVVWQTVLRPWIWPETMPLGRLPSIEGRTIGIVVGHEGYDSGAVCPDGLAEVEVNRGVALRLERHLRSAGARVHLLEEFDDRLPGYQADVLISLHADSCLPDLSGFKVARATLSHIPERDDRLVDCLYARYETVTNLPRHDASITHDMTNYHAFRAIDPATPAAIIEMGFLGGDRALLTQQPDLVARGLVEGLACFFDEQ